MSQWGSSDAASNSVIWAPTNKNQAPTRANANLMYGNTTSNAYGDGQRVSLLAVDSTEEGVGAGVIVRFNITNAGSGYGANAAVTLAGGGGVDGAANASVSATGRISAVNIENAGSSYETNPTVTIAAPAAVTFNGNSAISNTADTIAISTANSKFLVGDRVTYTVAAGNTAANGLVSGTNYYISFANTTVVALAATKGGANVDITSGGPSETGHSLTGETATAVAVVGGAKNKGVAHTGWVVRTEGTGGRAGRVQYEVLVAGGIVSDNNDDEATLPDA